MNDTMYMMMWEVQVLTWSSAMNSMVVTEQRVGSGAQDPAQTCSGSRSCKGSTPRSARSSCAASSGCAAECGLADEPEHSGSPFQATWTRSWPPLGHTTPESEAEAPASSSDHHVLLASVSVTILWVEAVKVSHQPCKIEHNLQLNLKVYTDL